MTEHPLCVRHSFRALGYICEQQVKPLTLVKFAIQCANSVFYIKVITDRNRVYTSQILKDEKIKMTLYTKEKRREKERKEGKKRERGMEAGKQQDMKQIFFEMPKHLMRKCHLKE